MPRLIDYVGRYEFIRQAAFAVVRDEGVDALSRRRVAKELGTSVNTIRRSVAGWADLARFAADQVESRRRVGRLGLRAEAPTQRVAHVVRSLMPEDATHLDEELVWFKLVAACALRPSGLESSGQLRREFGIGQRGYDDGLAPAEDGVDANAAGDLPGVEDRRAALAHYLIRRDHELAAGVHHVLDLMGVAEPREDAASTVVALIEGLSLSACLGRITPEHATRLAIDEVTALGVRAPADDPSRSAG